MKIVSATLANGLNVSFGDFNVITGGNGVGKSTMLAELFDRVCEIPRSRYYWRGQPEYDSTDVARDYRLLESSLSRQWEGANFFYYSSATKGKGGTVELDADLRFSAEERSALAGAHNADLLKSKKYRRPFVTYVAVKEFWTVARR